MKGIVVIRTSTINEQVPFNQTLGEFSHSLKLTEGLSIQLSFVSIDIDKFNKLTQQELDAYDMIICHSSCTKSEYYIIKNSHYQRYYETVFYVPSFPFYLKDGYHEEIDRIVQLENTDISNGIIDLITREYSNKKRQEQEWSNVTQLKVREAEELIINKRDMFVTVQTVYNCFDQMVYILVLSFLAILFCYQFVSDIFISTECK